MIYVTELRIVCFTLWEQEHRGLHNTKNTVSFTTDHDSGFKRWEKEHCGLHDGNKNAVGYTTQTKKLLLTRLHQEHC